MSNSCGEIRFMEGGTLKDSTVLSSSVVNSTVSNSTIESTTITHSTVDSDTAANIIQQIVQLPESTLKILVDAIAARLSADVLPAGAAVSPVSCAAGSMPATIIGDDNAVLGVPGGWIKTEDGLIPVYASDCLAE